MNAAAPQKIKVMYLIWSLDRGGAEQVVMNLAKGLDRKAFEPLIVCLNRKGRLAPQMEALGVRVVELGKKGAVDLLFLLRLIRLIKSEHPDLIHTHLFTSNLWGRAAAFFTKTPVVITEHNVDVWKKKIHFMLDRLLLPVSSRVICVSRKVEEFYRERVKGIEKQSCVIYNGIETERFTENVSSTALRELLNLDNNAVILGIVGRLVPQKAHKDFIQAVEHLQARNHDIVGVIFGDGEMRAELEAYVAERFLKKHIIFAGFHENMAEVYPLMDIFVLCSYREGFPMTILEAMSANVPVVATDVGGVSECVTDHETGLLIPPHQVDRLSAAIEELLKDTGLRRRLAENGRASVHRSFSVEHMAGEHAVLYQDVLKARGKNAAESR